MDIFDKNGSLKQSLVREFSGSIDWDRETKNYYGKERRRVKIKRREDKGFDFYEDGKKTTIERYAEVNRMDVNNVRAHLAKAGDKEAMNIITKQWAQSQPVVQDFNAGDVRDQRERLLDLQKLAGRTKFNSDEDLRNRDWALGELQKLSLAGEEKGGDIGTFFEDMIGGQGRKTLQGQNVPGVLDTYGRAAKANARVIDDVTVGSQKSADKSRQELIMAINNQRRAILNNSSKGPKTRSYEDLSAEEKRVYDGLGQKAQQLQASAQATSQQILEETDPTKYAGASAQIGLDAIGLRAAAPLVTGAARTTAGNIASKTGQVIFNPRGGAQGLVSGGVLGAGYGAAATAESMGADATAEDYLQGAAMGAGLGAGLGGTLGLGGTVAREARRRPGDPVLTNKRAKDLISFEGAPDKARVAEYKAQLDAEGTTEPLLVIKDKKTGKYGIEDGKHRYEAYKQAGIKDIPVIDITPVRMNALQRLDEAASRAGKRGMEKFYATTPGQKIQEAVREVQTKIQNSAAPIYRDLNRLQTAGRLSGNDVKIVKEAIQTSRSSVQSIANSFMVGQRDSFGRVIQPGDEDFAILSAPINGKVLSGKARERLSDYINARNELNLIEIDKKRGADINPAREAHFRKRVAELGTPEFEARFDADVRYNAKLTDILIEAGIVDPKDVARWRANNTEYIRIQRVIDDLSEMRGQGTGAKVSRGSTMAQQKRKGSTRKAQDALFTAMDRTNKVFAEVYSQRAANAYIEALEKAGALGKQLRSAEKVAARQDLREALALSRPLKNQLARFEKSQLQYVRRVQGEIDKLSRAGLAESLARPLADENLAGKLADPGARMSKAELQSVLDNIVQNTDTRLLKAIRKQIARREPKLAKAIDELQDIQSVLSGVNAQRINEFSQLAQNADEKSRSRPTIARFKDGIKEVYETTPEIEKAAKGMGPVYMGTVGRIISAPVRFLQTTITGGLNPAWALTAIPRDFVEGLVLSRNAAQTHNPANILSSSLEAAGIKGMDRELFGRFMEIESGNSSVIDLTRGAISNAQTLRAASRQQMPAFKKGASVITHPNDLWQAVQDSAKWNEQWTKYQNFRGSYNKLINDGASNDEAFSIALYDARNATGNLTERGDWTSIFAAFLPYFNPAIQGGTTLARALRDRPIATSAKIVTAVQIPAMIATAWNMSDPRRAEAYLDLSPSERDRYTIFVLPGSEKTDGKWQVIKIPKAPGVGNFANPIERTMIAMYGQDPGRTEQIWQSLLKAFGSPIDPSSPSAALGSIIPLQIKAPIEGVANFNFYRGKEIVPDWVKEENPDEPYKQAFDNTSSTYKKIGQMLGISPLIVENFANSTTGEFGRNVTWLSDVSQEMAGISDSTEAGGRSPVESVTKAYLGAYGGEREREAKEQINTIFNQKTSISSDITEALAQGDQDTANRLANEYNTRIDELEGFLEKNSRTVELSDKQKEALKNNRFPVENGQLSLASIRSRLRNLQK